MDAQPPEKIHLIPDEYHLVNVGVLPDGRRIYHGTELHWDGSRTRDFLVTYLFDADGRLVHDVVSEVGVRGAYAKGRLEQVFDKEHLALLEPYAARDIWIRPFAIERFGIEFGFICRRLDDEGDPDEDNREVWRVEAMPSNGLSFYPPWEEGGYDT